MICFKIQNRPVGGVEPSVIHPNRGKALTLSYTGLSGGKTASNPIQGIFKIKLPTGLF